MIPPEKRLRESSIARLHALLKRTKIEHFTQMCIKTGDEITVVNTEESAGKAIKLLRTIIDQQNQNNVYYYHYKR